MGGKAGKHDSARHRVDRMYSDIDKDLGLKEPERMKDKYKKEVAPTMIPNQCKDCKFRHTLDYVNKVRQFGTNFICEQKEIDLTVKKEPEVEL